MTGLIDAIDTAASGDTISLAAGCTYTLTIVNNDTGYGLNGLPVIDKTLTIEGSGATIERSYVDGMPEFRILHVGAGGDLSLNDLTISNGFLGSWYGGGIYNEGILTIANSTISGNVANDGGGI